MALEQDIATWIERQSMSLNLHDAAGRRALLFAAGLSDLQNAFDFEGATGVFCRNLTQRLWQHGTLSDGRDPLIVLLETAKTMVGTDRQAECAALIDQLRHAERKPAASETWPVEPSGIAQQAQDHVTQIGQAQTVAINYNHYGVSEERFEALHEELAVTRSALKSFFKILQEQHVPLEDLDSKLRDIAKQYKELLQRLEWIRNEDPQVAALKTEARQAIEAGKFAEAETLLNQAERRDLDAIEQLQKCLEAQQAALKQRRMSAAETNADNARLQEIQLRYAKAAEYWRQAATLLPEEEQQTRGYYLNEAGYDFYRVARYADALALYEQSLTIRREIDDKIGEGMILNNISQVYYIWGDYETALAYLEKSLLLAHENGDSTCEEVTLNNLSLILKEQGDYTAALAFLEKSLAITTELGDKTGILRVLNNLSQIFKAQGDYVAAFTLLEQNLAIYREIGDKAGEGTTLLNLSQIYDLLGDYATALIYLEKSLAIYREIGDKEGLGTVLGNIGTIYYVQCDYTTALTYLGQSLDIAQEIGDKVGEGRALGNIGAVYHKKGEYITALSYLEQSLAIYRKIGNKAVEITILNNLSLFYDTLCDTLNDDETALIYLEQCLEIYRKFGDKAGEGITLNDAGQIYLMHGEYAKALSYFEQSLLIRREIGDKAGEGTTLHNLGVFFYVAIGSKEHARQLLYTALHILDEIGSPDANVTRDFLEKLEFTISNKAQ